MPLNETDKAWIRQEIREANATFGSKLRTWIPALSVGALLIFALTQWNGYVEFKTRTDDRLIAIEKAIDAIQLKLSAFDPASSASDVTELLNSAKQKNIQISADTVSSVGKKFVLASKTSPNAWEAIPSLLGYRSFLNISLVPIPEYFQKKTEPPSHVKDWNFQFTIMNCVRLGINPEAVPAVSAARLEKIDSGVNSSYSRGPKQIMIEGVNESSYLELDGYWVKNAIISNVRIKYEGGPLILENVQFVNCTFDLPLRPNTDQLAEKILSGTTVTMNTSS